MNTPTLRTHAFASLFLGALAISMAPIFVKWAAEEGQIGWVAAAFWRVTLASPVFFIVQAAAAGRSATRQPRRPRLRDVLWLMTPGLFFAGDLAVWHASFAYTTLANATLLANLATIFVAIVARIWLKERFTWLFPTGGLAALVGTAVLVGVSRSRSPEAALGDGMAIITAVFYAGYILSIKLLRAHWDTTTLMAWSTLSCAAALALICPWTPGGFWPVSANGWLALVALALFSHCAGQGLIAFALAHLPASLSSVSLLVQPVSTAILSWLIFGQSLNAQQIASGGLVLFGILLARLGSKL